MNILKSAKRYWWLYVLVLLSLSLVLTNLYYSYKESRDSQFAFENIKKITRIEISDSNNIVILEKTDNSWLLNSSSVADGKTVSELLRSISIIEATSPVPISIQDSAKRIISSKGTKVQIFTNRKKVKSYALATTEAKNQGNIGQLDGSNEVYRLHLLGLKGSILELFNPSPTFWKSNKLDIPPLSDINAVEVEISDKLDQSYRIDISNYGRLSLYALQKGLFASAFDTLKLHRFLNEIVNVNYKYIVHLASTDYNNTIKNSKPEFSFTIYCKNSEKISLKIYPIPVNEYTNEFGRTIKHDLNRLYLTQSSNNNVYIVNFIDIYTILKEISFFSPIF